MGRGRPRGGGTRPRLARGPSGRLLLAHGLLDPDRGHAPSGGHGLDLVVASGQLPADPQPPLAALPEVPPHVMAPQFGIGQRAPGVPGQRGQPALGEPGRPAPRGEFTTQSLAHFAYLLRAGHSGSPPWAGPRPAPRHSAGTAGRRNAATV